MTTIVYRDGVLASDSRETVGEEIIRDDAQKIHRLSDGSLYAGAHTSEQIELVRLAALKGEELPDHLDDVVAVHIKPDGSVWETEGRIWQRQRGQPFYALGSGAPYARAAMKAGASAVQAVEIAKSMDIYSGGAVQCLTLEQTDGQS